MTKMQGSYEDRRHRVEEAVTDVLRELRAVPEDESLGVIVNGTYENEIVVTAFHGVTNDDQSYRVPYEIDDRGGVSLGEPQPVDLKVVWTPEEAPDGSMLETEPTAARFVQPAITNIDEATVMLTAAGREAKSLTDQDRDNLAAAATRLLDTLAVKNMNVAARLHDDEDEPVEVDGPPPGGGDWEDVIPGEPELPPDGTEPETPPPPPSAELDEPPPSDDEDDEDMEGKGVVVLDQAAIYAELAELSAE